MKTTLVIVFATVIALTAWWLSSPKHTPHEAHAPHKTHPAATLTDPATVFQKAFWKRPTTEDHILHAERREWQDHTGISKWQWFISVKPSAALLDHLITQNAFSLIPAQNPKITPEVPNWFPASKEPFEAFTSTTGTFTVLWDKSQNLLHATDFGHGFRPGAPAPPSTPLAASQPQGRLPITPPPRP